MDRSNQKGFSLIELMVAVAIIGLLSVVAIPQYQKYKAKARQGEAKLSLSTLYTMEKVFITTYGYGTANFSQLGFNPKGVYHYSTGWPHGNRYGTPHNVNKFRKSDITGLPVSYTGPLAKDAQGQNDENNVNSSTACDRATATTRRKPCFLKTPTTGNGGMAPPRVVTASQLGESNPRNIIINNNGYKDVKFLIGARNIYNDTWIITEKKKLLNFYSNNPF